MSRPLRVLSIGHSYVVALNRAVMREVARDPGIDLTVAAPTFFHGDLRPIPLEPEPAGSPLKVVPIDVRWTKRVHVFHYDRAALRALLAKKFDVVHMWEEPYILAGYQIARALRNDEARLAFWTCQNYAKRFPPPFGNFERYVLRRAQGWIAIGGTVHEAMMNHGYPATNDAVLPLAVDLSAFRPLGAHERAKVRNELGLAGTVIGFVGRLNSDKGLPLLMSALERIRPMRPWSVLFLGSGELRAKIETWAKQQGLAGRVKIALVKHAEVPRYVGIMDLLVAPSQTMPNWKEQLGRMLIEAFACGVPVVASNSGEIPYVVGSAGIVLREKDVDAWAQTITRLIDEEAERATLALKGIERAKSFGATSIAKRYGDYFAQLARTPISMNLSK